MWVVSKGYVGTLSSADFPSFDQLRQHLLKQLRIEEIQRPRAIYIITMKHTL